MSFACQFLRNAVHTFATMLTIASALAGCVTTPGRDEALLITGVAYCGGSTLAAATSSAEVALFSVSPYSFRALLTREADKRKPSLEEMFRPPPVVCSPDGTLLVSAGVGGAVVGWDVDARTERFRASAEGKPVGLAFFPDGLTFVMVGPAAQRRDAKNGAVIAEYRTPGSVKATAVAISRTGAEVLIGLENGDIAEYESSSPTHLRVLHGHAAPVSSIAFSPDGQLFASTAGRFDPRIWNRTESPPIPRRMSEVGAIADSLGRAERDTQMAMMFVWLLGTARGFQIVGAPTMGALPVLSPSLERAAREPAKLCEPQVAFSPDGRFLAATANLSMLSGELHAFLADAASNKGRMIPGVYGCYVGFSPDSRTMVTAGLGNPKFWRLESGEPVEVTK